MFVENIASFNQNLKYLVTEGSNLFEIKFTPRNAGRSMYIIAGRC